MLFRSEPNGGYGVEKRPRSQVSSVGLAPLAVFELVDQAGREREAVLKEGREDPMVLLG